MTDKKDKTAGTEQEEKVTEPATWLEAVQQDRRYQQFSDAVKTQYRTKHFDTLMDKLAVSFQERVIRDIKTRQLTGDARDKLVTILLENQQLRSSLVEYKGDAYALHSSLTDYQAKVVAYLKNQYAVLFNVYKNEPMRKAAVERVMARAETKLRDMEAFIYFCDERIKDIDQEKWAVKNIVDVLSLNESKGAEI